MKRTITMKKKTEKKTRHKFKKVLLLGSGALRIGTGGEFDFSGSQAIKSLKEEGIKVILVNPNIATVQTSQNFADKVYFVPVSGFFVEKIIKKENPDGILLGFGGQNALNCGVELERKGILKKYKVAVIGTSVESIVKTEDRELFREELDKIDVRTPKSISVNTMKEVDKLLAKLSYPVMVRTAFSLGGENSGKAKDKKALKELAQKALATSPQILIEEYLENWKELEYEVVRDSKDNCITVCNMENMDPMGVHTGESIVVAPSQTLTHQEHYTLRELALKIVRHFKVVGECNIQFALDPKTSAYSVIEMNARLSRSSALASKATGYPLAYIAAKLGLGYSLTELENSITKKTKAFFEPALDYLVVKIPRWDLQKFKSSATTIGTEMKSIGEVMSIGRSFEEAIQKAARMLDINMDGIIGRTYEKEKLKQLLSQPTDERLFIMANALEQGMTPEEIHKYTGIDKWFLYALHNIVKIKEKLSKNSINKELMREAKQAGFSDKQIAEFKKTTEDAIRKFRKKEHIIPVVKQIDTLAAEYPAKTNYLYTTYHGEEDDIVATQGIMVLGSGTYRIGSSVEFDWCSVNALRALKKMKYKTIMINCNPETVSTDYDEADKLYFDELTEERVMDIYEKEASKGVIISVGGQIPNKLSLKLHERGAKILGTHPNDIDRAENRYLFSTALKEVGIEQPPWQELTTYEDAERFAKKVGFPVIVRPSYVLSGAAMSVIQEQRYLKKLLEKATNISKEHPVVIAKFILNAKEIEFDAVAQKGEVKLYAIAEHIENAGVHSGDATIIFPSQKVYEETSRKILEIGKGIAKKLNITGPFNIQFLAKENELKVIECNVRASRSMPFVSKIMRKNFIETSIEAIMGKHLETYKDNSLYKKYVGVKSAQFSFSRLHEADPRSGVEMASTGEVACIGKDVNEALLKSLLAVDFVLPKKTILISIGELEEKIKFMRSAKKLIELGYTLYATEGTYETMKQYNIKATLLHKTIERKKPNIKDYLKQKKIELVINVPKQSNKENLSGGYRMRRIAADYQIPLITNLQLAQQIITALSKYTPDQLEVKSWDEY